MGAIEPRLSNVPDLISHHGSRVAPLVGLLISLLFAGASVAAGAGDSDRIRDDDHRPDRIEYRFDSELPAPAGAFRDRTYFGQTKIGDSWHFGVVIDHGDDGVGVSFRGMAIIRRF